MDRFLRFNRGQTVFGNGLTQPQPTIVVQPAPVVPPEPAPPPIFIENTSLEARVACDPSNQPALLATVRGRPILQSDYGDGTNGYTALRAPSLNTSVTTKDVGLYIVAPGLNLDGGKVLTSQDTEGRCEFKFPTRLVADSENLYTFVQAQERDIKISVDYDTGAPPGKLRVQSQYNSTPGNVLTYVDSEYGCEFQPIPPVDIPPSPTIFVSASQIPVNPTATTIYPAIPITSTAESWSATVDTTFVVTAGQAVTLYWALFNSLNVQYGPTVATNINSAGSIVRIVYQYTFYQVSPTELRFTATSTITSGTNSIVRLPANFLSVDLAGGIPFIRMQKSATATTTVTVASRSAYYNALNWVPTPALAPFSVMRMAGEAAVEPQPDEKDVPTMDPPAREDFPLTLDDVTNDGIQAIVVTTDKLIDQLVDVYQDEDQSLRKRGSELGLKLEGVYESVVTELETECAAKRQRLI